MMNQLEYGIQYNNQNHYDFTVRLPVVRDSIHALQATAEALGTTSGTQADIYYRVSAIAACIELLGTIPKDELNADFLLDNLVDSDLDIIDAAIAELKKKRKRGKNVSLITGQSSSPLASAESVSNVLSQ